MEEGTDNKESWDAFNVRSLLACFACRLSEREESERELVTIRGRRRREEKRDVTVPLSFHRSCRNLLLRTSCEASSLGERDLSLQGDR